MKLKENRDSLRLPGLPAIATTLIACAAFPSAGKSLATADKVNLKNVSSASSYWTVSSKKNKSPEPFCL